MYIRKVGFGPNVRNRQSGGLGTIAVMSYY